MTIEQLKLSPNARRAARLLAAQFPTIQFTSGRRDALDQARVMAHNLMVDKNWMLKTYKPTPVRTTLQRVVDESIGVEAKVLATRLYDAMLATHSGQLTLLSRHLTGDAFDLAWPGDDLAAHIVEALRALPPELGFDKVLTKEGHLQLIHAQFAPSVEV